MRGWMIAHKDTKMRHHAESLSWSSEAEAWDRWFLANPLETEAEHEVVAVDVETVVDPDF